ncbi:MAG TPA: ankyrin repeat domain-containing protein [Gammaproteobacteria bacterium]|nr:ankyrin repeat domain-containing protein [Gammaproteobacteria bacterium]
MRVQRSSLSFGWAVLAVASLVGCSRDPPPLRFDAAGNFQPATLAEAVLFRNRTAVENFLALGVDPNEPEPDGTTPLMRAVNGETLDIAQLLIDASADVNKANYYGVTALYIAARDGDASATRMLLAAGANANVALPAGETVLMTAAKAGNPEVVRALLTGGVEAVSLTEIGEARAAAGVAEAAGYSAQTNPALATNYADVNARERWYGRTALMIAALEGHAAVVELLIEAGADPTLVDEEGSTALTLARSSGNLDVAAKLAALASR